MSQQVWAFSHCSVCAVITGEKVICILPCWNLSGILHRFRLLLIYIGKLTDNDVVMAHPSVSRFHALLVIDKALGAYVVDLGTSNGSFVDGRVSPREYEHRSLMTDVVRDALDHKRRWYIGGVRLRELTIVVTIRVAINIWKVPGSSMASLSVVIEARNTCPAVNLTTSTPLGLRPPRECWIVAMAMPSR